MNAVTAVLGPLEHMYSGWSDRLNTSVLYRHRYVPSSVDAHYHGPIARLSSFPMRYWSWITIG